jgi:hypothetical protein
MLIGYLVPENRWPDLTIFGELRHYFAEAIPAPFDDGRPGAEYLEDGDL